MACNLWFGTQSHAEFIETPLSGAESTPEGWRATGTLLSGGGYGSVSTENHKVYDYSWRNSSSRQMAQKMQAYRSGVYGQGLLYFVDPLIYDTNVLPAQWSTFVGSVGSKSAGPLPGAERRLVRKTGFEKLGLPAFSTRFTATSASQGLNRSVYIPIPEGYELYLGAFFEASGFDISVRVQDYQYEWASGLVSGSTLTPLNPSGTQILDTSKKYRGRGIEITLTQEVNPFGTLGPCVNSNGKPLVEGEACYWNASQSGWGTGHSFTTTDAGASKKYILFSGESKAAPNLRTNDTTQDYNAWIDIWAITARLVRIGKNPNASGPWIMGQGHSGAVFDSEPTYIEYSGVNGGQVGFAASYREVGSWQ